MLHLRSTSLAHTHAIAAALAGLSRSGDLVVLAGEMGSGKMAFVQGFAAALGVIEPVTSPTYTLVHSYEAGRVILHHADIYRLATMNEVADLALNELLEYDGIVLVEWGDVVARSLGDHLMVRLDPADPADTDNDADNDADNNDADNNDDDDNNDDERVITVSATGRSWALRWERVEAVLSPFFA